MVTNSLHRRENIDQEDLKNHKKKYDIIWSIPLMSFCLFSIKIFMILIENARAVI